MDQRESPTSGIRTAKRHVRRLFYIGSLSTVVLLALTLSLFHLKSLTSELDSMIDQLSSSLIQEKKRFLRDAVERTIHHIDFERAAIRREHAGSGLSEAALEAMVKDKVKNLIRGIRLVDDGYIWVNHIIDYGGGDNYAVRAVHPNLPHTEGAWLSTSTTDVKGNKPYEAELVGMKQDGELFFEYYFKKLNSGDIAHKMSFAKLYKPYDWVVATGVYLDDVDALIASETRQMKETYRSQIRLSVSISLLVVLLASLSIFIFEKQITGLISRYEGTICDYTASLERLSCTDVLTGLPNRLKLDEVFTYELHQSQRYGKSFSILMIDLDRFKNVNDTLGHQAGDEVLVQTAGILRNNSRKTDTVGRWGGEEFLVLMPNTDNESALIVAENIRQAVAAHEFSNGEHITCSIGVSSYVDKDRRETMVERADKALYCAKSRGRNRIEYEYEGTVTADAAPKCS